MRGTAGLRKVRWSIAGHGKRGGIRVIYYWLSSRDQIYMLLAYGKNVQDDLTEEQRRVVMQAVELEIANG